jgi:hypothetical protein
MAALKNQPLEKIMGRFCSNGHLAAPIAAYSIISGFMPTVEMVDQTRTKRPLEKKQKLLRLKEFCSVGRVGLEPTRYLYRRILSPLRLPIPPPPHAH